MNIKQLRYFLAVAQELNFTRAAERVRIAQPALSQQVIQLEQELGTALFIRDNRGVSLTAAGEVLVDHAHRVLNAEAAAVEAVRLAEQRARSSMAVGAIYSSLYAFLPDVLRAFAVNEPNVELNLQEMTINQQVHALCEGAIEVGLLRGPIHHRELSTEILYRERLVLAAPINSEWAEEGPVSLRQVAEMPLVAVQRQESRSYSDRVFELFEVNDVHPRIVHHTQDMHTGMCLVAAGLGVAIVPSVVQLLQTSGVRFRPLVEAHAGVTFALAMRRTSHSRSLEAFVQASRAKAADMLARFPELFVRQDAT